MLAYYFPIKKPINSSILMLSGQLSHVYQYLTLDSDIMVLVHFTVMAVNVRLFRNSELWLLVLTIGLVLLIGIVGF